MTPAQKAQQTAYNEFIADYVERHGECKATRDEAHTYADWIVAACRGILGAVRRFGKLTEAMQDAASDLVGVAIDGKTNIDGKDEAKFLAACAIAAALEVVG